MPTKHATQSIKGFEVSFTPVLGFEWAHSIAATPKFKTTKKLESMLRTAQKSAKASN
ncbi:MAG: hypothetical protein KGH94_05470 [Candidatus Micrarchaeota archaeon]|nr:hypothetical protein [Candidatus Micrarchaeota archaeon]